MLGAGRTVLLGRCEVRDGAGALTATNAAAGGCGEDSDLAAPTLRGRQRGHLDRGWMCLDQEGPATLNHSQRT